MRTSTGIAAALLPGLALAGASSCAAESSLLYVAAYPADGEAAGKLTTFKLDKSSLQSVAASDDCGPFPTWLTQANDVLYCINAARGSTAGGVISSLKIGADGSVTKLGSIGTIGDPVNTVAYGEDSHGLAMAHYEGGGIAIFDVADPSNITTIQAEVFDTPTTNTSFPAQSQSHPHQVILDPTGGFLVVPDLGADLLRIFQVNKTSLRYTNAGAYPLPRGSGPRHGAFLKAGDKTFLYTVSELSNSLTGFSVDTSDSGLALTQIYNATTHGDAKPLPAGTAAAEIHISPDNKFLTLSSRYERSLKHTTADGTVVDSDPLITFSVNAETGALAHVQTAPAGGIGPRHFAFNGDGSLVAAAAQDDGRVVVFARDVATGMIGKPVAETKVAGLPKFVMFG
ncbi:extracellular aldonolactonase [Trichocladium antarcticum]|uniref:Extracellular aldonolactonase n=1 Tax=Trichocladium antarcticum TaxID=1450529 RepID=A0AAN6ZCP9_9PEZI|nr:extracellular aldonolactonase [Trichocladium antarcticum]